MSERRITVLVAEDSPVIRRFLVHVLESDPEIRVIGAVADGQAALDFVERNRPDVILMDIHMPRLDGFEATRRILQSQAVPIVICSATTNVKDAAIAFRAMEAGAVACIEKPGGREFGDFEAMAANLLSTVKLMAFVRVVRRRALSRPAVAPVTHPLPKLPSRHTPAPIKVIGIGASTGGPLVLQTIFAGLPKEFPIPILVVQHIASNFVHGMSEWLSQTTGFRVQIGTYGVCPRPGHVYLAPDDFHMGVGSDGRIVLTREAPENHLRPAVSYLFRSLAKTYGPNALGVLLTGMGRDGAEELKAMKDEGAITIAQDFASSVVHGMPGEAIALGGTTHVLPADEIASALITFATDRNARSKHV
jgi:two-component system chemotaxis response regulator CheB